MSSMVMLPFGFAHCPACGRLLTIDSLNPSGRCTRDCGGVARPPVCPCGDTDCAVYSALDGWNGLDDFTRHALPYWSLSS